MGSLAHVDVLHTDLDELAIRVGHNDTEHIEEGIVSKLVSTKHGVGSIVHEQVGTDHGGEGTVSKFESTNHGEGRIVDEQVGTVHEREGIVSKLVRTNHGEGRNVHEQIGTDHHEVCIVCWDGTTFSNACHWANKNSIGRWCT